MAYAGNPIINTVIPGLYLIGGFGFIVIVGLFNYRSRQNLDINVKVMLTGTIGLSILGTIMIYLFESDNPATLAALPRLSDQLWASWLQATTPRTAGFNSLDIALMSQPTCVVLIALMFIGAGANGTGGGIKITTLFVLAASTWANIRGRRTPTLFTQRIDTPILLKALAVTVMATIGIFMGTLALSMTEDASLLAIVFEITSALGTVGLTRGLTADLSGWGQAIIITTMFIGRLCPLTVAYLVGFFLFPRRQDPRGSCRSVRSIRKRTRILDGCGRLNDLERRLMFVGSVSRYCLFDKYRVFPDQASHPPLLPGSHPMARAPFATGSIHRRPISDSTPRR